MIVHNIVTLRLKQTHSVNDHKESEERLMPRTFFGRYVRLDRSEFWTSTGCVRSAWRKQLQPAGGCCDWRCRRWRTVATVRLPVLSLSGWSAERWWYWCESAIGLWIKTLRPIRTEVITFAFVLSTIMATMLTKQKHKEWVLCQHQCFHIHNV